MRDVILDLVSIFIRNMIGKYTKLILERLEKQKLMTPAIRKVVLDTMNDMSREIQSKLTDLAA